MEKMVRKDRLKERPKHIPIPIPAMLSSTFTKTMLQRIAMTTPIMIPRTVLLCFMSCILPIPIWLQFITVPRGAQGAMKQTEWAAVLRCLQKGSDMV